MQDASALDAPALDAPVQDAPLTEAAPAPEPALQASQPAPLPGMESRPAPVQDSTAKRSLVSAKIEFVADPPQKRPLRTPGVNPLETVPGVQISHRAGSASNSSSWSMVRDFFSRNPRYIATIHRRRNLLFASIAIGIQIAIMLALRSIV